MLTSTHRGPFGGCVIHYLKKCTVKRAPWRKRGVGNTPVAVRPVLAVPPRRSRQKTLTALTPEFFQSKAQPVDHGC